jgi:hypothetical protein
MRGCEVMELNAYMNGYQPEGDTEFLSASLEVHKKALQESQQKVERLEKALEFYADLSTYKYYKMADGILQTKIDIDTGDKARQALETEGDE